MRSVLLVGLSPLVLLACSKEEPIAPTASILSPQDGETYYADQKILFEGLITDDVESPNELSVVWKSDIDGELDWANEPDSKGRISGHGYLTEGDHSISLTATDTDGLIGRDSLLLTIGPNNSAPSCAITTPPEGTATNEGDAVTLVAQVDDVDVGPLELSLSWASDLAGELGTSTADLNGLSSLEVEGLALGTHTVTLTVADEMGLECQAQIQHKIGQAPRLTWQVPDAEAVLSSESPGYAVLLVEDDAHAAEDLEVLWESSLDGSLDPDPIDSEGLSQRTLEDLSLGTHVLTAIATNPDDLSGTASLTLTVNGVPEAPSVVILPDPSTTTNDLTAVVTEGADPEGDAQTFLYQWSKDGVLDSSVTGDVVPNTATAKGQEWTVRVTPNDGYGSGPLGEASIVVANTPPVVSMVSISPTNPTVSDTLVCSYGYADDDSDADASTIEWTVGSAVVGTGASLAGSSLSKDDVVTCTVTANDGQEDGNSESDSITVLNSEPVLSSVSITPNTGVTTSSTLSCSATATDADGESPSIAYAWTNGSTSIGSSSTLTLSNTTSSPTDSITCTATATDGSSASVSDTASVTVENTLPVIASVSISPTNPTVTDTVTCSATASDADGDTPTLSYAWTDGSTSLGTSASLDLNTSGLAKGNAVACEVTATDDQGDTDTQSDTVVITNSVPTVSSVAISPTSPTVNDALTCSYTFSDNDSDSDASTIAWTVGSTTIGTGATLAAGSASKNEAVSCTVTPNDGSDTGTAVSDTVTVINTAPVVSGVSISPTSPTVSDALTCSYSFADDDSDADSSSVTWTVGSTSLGTGSTLSAGSASKGETVVCTVEANDGEDTGNTATSNVTIQNSAPTAPVVSISPSAPVALVDDLVCSIDTASTDADGDSITYTVLWEVEGASWTGSTSTTSQSGDTVSASDLVYDEEWTCSITPDDGTVAGTSGEDSVTVVCQDADGDGYSDSSCGGTDCDDSDDTLTPEDADGDGYSTCDGDCDDANADASPGGTDGLIFDGDCDGAVSGGSVALAEYKFIGENPGDRLGLFSAQGDFDGDGLTDLLIGAKENDEGGSNAGAAYLFAGANLSGGGTYSVSTADYKFVGEGADDQAGRGVAFIDVDGDGLDDILITAPYDDEQANNAGAIYVFLAASLGTASTVDLSSYDHKILGEANDHRIVDIQSAGDWDSDGLEDILVKAPYATHSGNGKVYVVFGASLSSTSTNLLSQADIEIRGEDWIGYDAAVMDVDGDAVPDIVVTSSKSAFIFLGQTVSAATSYLWSLTDYDYRIDFPDSRYSLLEPIPDMGTDGIQELAFSQMSNANVWILDSAALGSPGQMSITASSGFEYYIEGDVSTDRLGTAMSFADFNADGSPDFLIGASATDHNGNTDAGSAYLIDSTTLPTAGTYRVGTLASMEFQGESASDYLSQYYMSFLNDVDGDGKVDIGMASARDDDAGTDAGAYYLLLSGG